MDRKLDPETLRRLALTEPMCSEEEARRLRAEVQRLREVVRRVLDERRAAHEGYVAWNGAQKGWVRCGPTCLACALEAALAAADWDGDVGDQSR